MPENSLDTPSLFSSNSTLRVSYFLDEEIANFYFGAGHPNRPQRVRLAHQLIEAYGLFPFMDLFKPHLASEKQLVMFHGDDYIHFLKTVTPYNQHDYLNELKRYGLGLDNPVFHGLYEYCQIYTGASLSAAYRLNKGLCDIAINWAGGAHHAKRYEASGFNYVNDCVLSILELLKYHQRVLYIDLDIHHASGVEEAFYTTNRVYTMSFHKYGDYFPGTGHIDDIGVDKGRNCSLNIPLRAGLTDSQFIEIFSALAPQVLERFQPNIIVLQCGADGIAGDRLGVWNLTLKSYEFALKLLKKEELPMLLLGGGGYNLPHTARLWAQLTAIAVDQDLNSIIPQHPGFEYYLPDCSLTIQTLPSLDVYNDSVYIKRVIERCTTHINDLTEIPHILYSPPPSSEDLPLQNTIFGKNSQVSLADILINPKELINRAHLVQTQHLKHHASIAQQADFKMRQMESQQHEALEQQRFLELQQQQQLEQQEFEQQQLILQQQLVQQQLQQQQHQQQLDQQNGLTQQPPPPPQQQQQQYELTWQQQGQEHRQEQGQEYEHKQEQEQEQLPQQIQPDQNNQHPQDQQIDVSHNNIMTD